MQQEKLYSRLLFIFLVLQAIFANTRFDFIQTIVELLLIFILVSGIKFKNLLKTEASVLIIGSTIYVLSFIIYNEPVILYVNYRIFLFLLLILILTRQKKFSFVYFKFIFLINLIIVFTSAFLNFDLLPRAGIVKEQFDEFLVGRPFGLFYSFHFSAFFTAVYILKRIDRTKYIQNIFLTTILLPSKSFFSIFGYFFAVLPRVIKIFSFMLLILLGFLWHSLDAYNFLIFEKSKSFGTILYQLMDLDRYKLLTPLLPMNYDVVNNSIMANVDWKAYYSRKLILENEIQYFTTIIQFGLPLTFILFLLIKDRIIEYRSFLLITMFHYAYLLNPMILFLILMNNGNEKE